MVTGWKSEGTTEYRKAWRRGVSGARVIASRFPIRTGQKRPGSAVDSEKRTE